MPNLIYNAIKTPDGTILESWHRHDYQTHQDENGKMYMVDGGLSYQRRSANGDEVDLSMYDDQPHEVQRIMLKWGTYGKDGKQPFVRKAIKDMDTDHIKAVLRECQPAGVIQHCMEMELNLRGESRHG